MIPVQLIFRFPCCSELVMRGCLHALPSSGDEVTASDEINEWTVFYVTHDFTVPNREVTVEMELSPGCEDLPWDRKERVKMRKRLEKAGWHLVQEHHSKLKKL